MTDVGSVGVRTVVLRRVSGQPVVGGVLFRTSLTGIVVEDHAHSGFSAADLAEGMVSIGAPTSDDALWAQVASPRRT